MDLVQGIIETARALGEDPLDIATIMSYETAGTFDPRQKGPTTQWGQHEGLIQFGQPQQSEYGVDLSSEEAALASQLGPDGAVARYFRGNGHQPGMGLLDLYSIVNAGAPGRYNASDANNGGAPGSVRDKVENQMADHRRNAERLLGSAGANQLAAPAQSAAPQNQLAPERVMPQLNLPQNQLSAESFMNKRRFNALGGV